MYECLLPCCKSRPLTRLQALLPVLTSAVFSSTEGFQSGYFLSGIDEDVVQRGGNKFTWSVSRQIS